MSGVAPRWRLAAASVAGTSHERRSVPCQDAFRAVTLPGSILIAAVSDGAGSAELAALGAALVVETTVDAVLRHKALLGPTLEDAGWDVLLRGALEEGRVRIEAEARERGVSLRSFSATALLLVAVPGVAAAIHIGDGAVVLGDGQGRVFGLTAPQNDDYLNVTTFLVSAGSVEEAHAVVWRGDLSHVALLSDGLQMIALTMPEGTPHAPFFAPLFRFMGEAADDAEAQAALEAFLASDRIKARTHDDLTLLVGALGR
jgi:hypothetical protein